MRKWCIPLVPVVTGMLTLPLAAQAPPKPSAPSPTAGESSPLAAPLLGDSRPLGADGAIINKGSGVCAADGCWGEEPCRRRFASDRAFPGFIGPISNPVLSKDPRALTEARALFINNVIPSEHPLGGGNFQLYGLEVRVALTERLSFIADKDGYAVIHPGVGGNLDGWVNINAGLKYALIRDVENQFLLTAGLMFEPQTGESEVFQGHGDGLMTAFLTSGKEFAEKWHLLGTFGYQFPMDSAENSSFIYTSLHLDRQVLGCLYPLIELNWFHYLSGGDRGLPPALGEGDGLLNLGTSGVAGNDLVTFAVGLKAKLGDHLETGAAWEFPLSNRKDLIDNRLTVELILRY